MKRNTDLLPKRILELSEEAKIDLSLSELNLNEKALASPGIKAKWVQILYEEEAYLKKLEKAKEALLKKYTEEHGQVGVPKFKTAAEATKQHEIISIDNGIKIQKDVIRYINGINQIFMSFNFEISNSVNIRKLESM